MPDDFDWTSYLLLNNDDIEAGLCDRDAASTHYRNHGSIERRRYLIHETVREGGSEKTTPVFLFFHVFCVNDWKEVFREQMELVVQSGLYGLLDRVYINPVGDEDALRFVQAQSSDDKWVVSRVEEGFEFSTMDLVSDVSVKGVFKGVYIHAKGVMHPSGQWQNEVRAFWRRFMSHQLLLNWRECQRLIQRYDLMGCIFRKGNVPAELYWKFHAEFHYPQNMKFTDHFSGNLFWFDSHYLSRIQPLTPAQRANRFNAEWHSFRNHPDMCEVFFDLGLWRARVLQLCVASKAPFPMPG